MTPEQLAEIFIRIYIKDMDDEFLFYVSEYLIHERCQIGIEAEKVDNLLSKDERYLLHVKTTVVKLFKGAQKCVWIFDEEENKFYHLNKDKNWKSFYQLVSGAMQMEKINKNN